MVEIVVGLDSSEDSLAALCWAADEARLLHATIIAVHAYVSSPVHVHENTDAARLDSDLHRHAEEALEQLLQEAGPSLAGLRIVRRLLPRRAAAALLDEAAAADLLVVGRRGAGGFEGLLLGSTAEHCARHARGPVVVVKAPLPATRGRVVVGVDGSAEAQRAVAWAVDHASRRAAALEVVGVYETYSAPGPYGGEFMQIASPFSEQRFRHRAEQVVADAIAAVDVPRDVAVESRVEAGHPAKVLIERSKDADLVVVGCRGLGGFSGLLLGSVSRQLLHHAACPAAVVHA